MLVISRYGLDARRFDGNSSNWANSEIRKWLNGEFYNKAFTDQEKKSIKSLNLSDVGTTDNVFLLSEEESEKYFANYTARQCKATDYAKNNGAWVSSSNGYCYWWLRSPYPDIRNNVYFVYDDGSIYYSNVIDFSGVVRLALWVNL